MKTKEIEFVYSKYPHLKNTREGKNPIIDFELYDLCDWLKEYSDLTNAKLVESLEYLRSCYNLELLNKAKLVEENEVMVEDLKMKDAVIAEFEEVQHVERKQFKQLQLELSAAKERVKELENGYSKILSYENLERTGELKYDLCKSMAQQLTPKQYG